MNIDVSIILISHNKFPQNMYALYSLEKQTYAPSNMEVILVDDNSTDETISLKNYKAHFNFKYCRTTTNLGRAGAKNFGIKLAEGEIVIFLDGEVIVASDFVANHLRHYSETQEITVSGNSSHYGIFSFLYPGFSKKQIRILHSCILSDPILIERLAKNMGLSVAHLVNFYKFWQHSKNNYKLLPIMTKKDIANQHFKNLSFPVWRFFPRIVNKYGSNLTGFHLAWIFFITRNVSVTKKLFDAVGLFNEEFRGWGSEDWELGYRLFKNGVKFIEDQDIVSYHQEHPFSRKKRREDQMYNYAKFTTLHPEIEVCALTLGLLKKRNYIAINNIIEDYYHIKYKYPNQFIYLQNAFIRMTQQIPLLLYEKKPVTRLCQLAGLEKEPYKNNEFFKEIELLRETGKYRQYLKALDLLLSL